jgi:ABC-2 type transport system permease protein
MTMSRLIRVEVLKLRTTPLVYALLATVAGLTALDAVVHVVQAGNGKFGKLDTASGLTDVVTISGFALVVSLVLGTVVANGEFRHQTATTTYLTSPRRGQVLVAKALAAAATGVVIGVVGSVVATAVGLIAVTADGSSIALAGTTMARYTAGAALGSALLAALGVGLGSLIRAELPVVVGNFLWGFFGESLLQNSVNVVGPYLPYTAATTLAGSPLGRSGFGFPNNSSVGALPFAVAAVLVAGIAVAVSLLAARTTVRRDIS